MNRQLYEDLRMFQGSISEIVNESGMTYESVRQVLRDGKWQNDNLVRIAQAVYNRRKAEMQARLKAA